MTDRHTHNDDITVKDLLYQMQDSNTRDHDANTNDHDAILSHLNLLNGRMGAVERDNVRMATEQDHIKARQRQWGAGSSILGGLAIVLQALGIELPFTK